MKQPTAAPSRPLPFHPFLFAPIPVMSLYSQNQHLLAPVDILQPTLYALGAAGVLFLLLAAITRDRFRAAATTSWIVLSFFFYAWLDTAIVLTTDVSPFTSFALWATLLLAGTFALVLTRQDLSRLTRVLNAVAFVALSAPLGSSLFELLRHRPAAVDAVEMTDPLSSGTTASAGASSPHVFYIILDAYGRHDVLRDYFGHDNEPFLAALEERGFYVARRSRSNYAQTILSLSSSLNSTYLDDVAHRIGEANTDRTPLREMIRHNRTAEFLRRRGYTFVTFSTGYHGTENPRADRYLAPWGNMSELEQMLLESTAVPAIFRALDRPDPRYASHRKRILFTLEKLSEPAGWHDPAFVFAHVFAPHPPFVFGPNGEEVGDTITFNGRDGGRYYLGGREQYVRRYRDQIRYLNTRVLAAVDSILANAKRPPIIVIQSDHGPGSNWDEARVERSDERERLSILNAFYFPDRRYERLRQEMTPVNTFRIILDQYFGSGDPLLADRSLISSWRKPYRFYDVTEKVRAYGSS